MKTERLRDIVVQVAEPVVVAVSAPDEERWGYHQFPAISRLPDGRLLVTFNDRPDRDEAYGTPGPAYVSPDGGATWTPWEPPDPLLSVSHAVISKIEDGHYLCAPIAPSLDITRNNIELPDPACRMEAYGEVLFYHLSECSADVQTYMATIPSTRWAPDQGKWQRHDMAWETREALIRTRKSDYVIPRPYLDNGILRYDGTLYYADFHLQHLLPDGERPKNYACWCMTSDDNGLSWKRLGLIAYDPAGELMMGEPCLLPTSDGRLACVIRCSHHLQKPMLITHSSDKGRTWSETMPLHDFGVMPQAILLGNEVAAVSFGRPGVHLMFSPDGRAREWVGPLSILAGDSHAVSDHSCGYTRLLAISEDSFLLAYSDFDWTGNDGRRCKAILVRRIVVSR